MQVAKKFVIIQIRIPVNVGITAAKTVHFKLPVSFFIVSRVVEHGQCISEKIMVLSAVIKVHPLFTNNSRICIIFPVSVKQPFAVYAIIAIGITISLAGNPKINAMRRIPSRPISLANGSRKFAQIFKTLKLPILTFAKIHIIRPAGAATATALPRTNIVLSKIDLTITFEN